MSIYIYTYYIIIKSRYITIHHLHHHGSPWNISGWPFSIEPPPSNESWWWIQTGPHHKFAWDASKGMFFFLPSNLPYKSTKTRANIAHTIHGTIVYLPIHEWLIVYGFHVGKVNIPSSHGCYGMGCLHLLALHLLFSNTWNPGSHLSTLRLDPKKQHGNKKPEPLTSWRLSHVQILLMVLSSTTWYG